MIHLQHIVYNLLLISGFLGLSRVKSLSKSGNSKKDPMAASVVPSVKESTFPSLVVPEDHPVQMQDFKGLRNNEKGLYNSTFDVNIYQYGTRNVEESVPSSLSFEREKMESVNSHDNGRNKQYPNERSFDTQDEEKVTKVSSPPKEVSREKYEKQSNWLKRESGSQLTTTGPNPKQMHDASLDNASNKYVEEIDAILEV